MSAARSLSPGAPESVDDVIEALRSNDYLPDEGLATVIYLAMRLRRPLLLEGEAGVGKTEVAKVLAAWTGGELIRLQCYEGIDIAQAVYEWDYSKQLLHLRALETAGQVGGEVDRIENELYSERFLVRRPLLRAVQPVDGPPPILLIDEVDRADDEFEAFLLEILADYSVTVPELGTFRAATPPIVIITSNRTRDVHDALKRRCLYHWVEHPSFEREVQIVQLRVPGACERLASRSLRSPSNCAASASTNRQVSPRRSTGRKRCCCSAPTRSPRLRPPRPSARCSSTARINNASRRTASA